MFSYESPALARAFRAFELCSHMPRKHRPCRALATWTPANTAPAVLWPLGRSNGLPNMPRTYRPCRALATWTPENTAPAVLWPLRRPKGLLEPQLGAPGLQSALKTARPLGRSNGLPNMPRTYRPCRALATWTPENTAPAVLWPLRRSSPRSVPPGRSKGLLKPLLGARGRSRPHLVPRHCPSRASGHFGRMTSQAR
jgi:hypothetical protein